VNFQLEVDTGSYGFAFLIIEQRIVNLQELLGICGIIWQIFSYVQDRHSLFQDIHGTVKMCRLIITVLQHWKSISGYRVQY